MSRWPLVVLSALTLTACTVQEAYYTGARDVLTALEAEVQQRQTDAVEPCTDEQYRLPVVTQMTVPTAMVGGVLIPEHQTYVVLQPGAWVQADGATPPPGCRPLQEGR
jgi:hypothetical protein